MNERNSCIEEGKDWKKHEFVDMDFSIWIYNIAKKRYAEGKDRRLLSFRIMTRAIPKMSLAPEIENILLNAEIKDDRYKNDE